MLDYAGSRPWKIVGDNLDVSVKVRDMRLDNPNQMHHFFHLIGVQDRIDTAHLDNTKPKRTMSSMGVQDFVPSARDFAQLRTDITVLVSRIAVSEFPAFEFMRNAVPDHITHVHSKEMSEKSKVVGGRGTSTFTIVVLINHV